MDFDTKHSGFIQLRRIIRVGTHVTATMMEKAATAGFRRCLRSGSGPARILRCTATTRNVCIATSICPARKQAKPSTFSPSSLPHTPNSQSQRSNTANLLSRRLYSSAPSSPQGTVGSGSAGIPAEAAKSKEALIAPEHLDEKERKIGRAHV